MKGNNPGSKKQARSGSVSPPRVCLGEVGGANNETWGWTRSSDDDLFGVLLFPPRPSAASASLLPDPYQRENISPPLSPRGSSQSVLLGPRPPGAGKNDHWVGVPLRGFALAPSSSSPVHPSESSDWCPEPSGVSGRGKVAQLLGILFT